MKELQRKKPDTSYLLNKIFHTARSPIPINLAGWVVILFLHFSTIQASNLPGFNRWNRTMVNALTADCGINGFVSSYVQDGNGDLYIGGAFTIANGITVNRIARWDGSHWYALGSGMDNVVYGLALSPEGYLIASGAFTSAGGVPANYIARWDGVQWSPLGQGTNAPVEPMVFMPGGELVVGGQFTMAGGIPANYIAQYKNGVWQALNSGMNNWVQALAIAPSGELYVGGRFTTVSNSSAMYIAKWDGTQWTSVGGGVNRDIRALAVAPDGNLFAGGGFTTAGGNPYVRIARWDGTQWHGLGGGVNSTVTSIDFSGVDVYISGNFTEVDGLPIQYLARWANGSWSGLGTGTDGDVFALKVMDDGAVIAGGLFTQAGGSPVKNIAKYQNNNWSGLCTPCICTSPTTLLTQADVDAFCCTGVFSGNLTIGPSTDIHDLTPLSGLTSVTGVLRIDGNSNLTQLHGLESMTTVNNLVVSNNALVTLQGLNNLNQVTNNLALLDNPVLNDISALAQVQLGINASLNIVNNAQLSDLTGLQSITHARAVTIQHNQMLQHLNGLQNLHDVDLWVMLQYNGLETLDGLSGLISIGNNLTIENNDHLQNLDGLANLTQFHGDLAIRYNPSLQHIDGLAGLQSLMNVSIVSNNQLANLDGFIPLQSITTGLDILNNQMLYSCCGIYTALSGNPNTVQISGNPGCATASDILIGCGDQDGDGYTTSQGDCDDNNPSVYPGAVDICNGLDDDCDGIIDNGMDTNDPVAKCIGGVSTTLDFDHLLFHDNQRHFYDVIHEDGFTLRQAIPGAFNQDQDVLVIHGDLSGFWWKGSPAVWLTLSSNPKTYAEVTKDDGAVFDVRSVSLASQLGSVVPQTVVFEGVKPDGSIVSQSLITTSATQLEQYTLDPSFNGLSVFRWSSVSDGGFQVDDIEIQSGDQVVFPLDANGLITLSPEDLDDGSFDACGPVILSLSKSIFTCEDEGLNQVELHVMDQAGHSSSCLVNVEIVDEELPAFTGYLPQNITVDCQHIPPVESLIGQDNCSFTIDFTEHSEYNGTCAQYDLIRRWTIRDDAGNTNEHNQIISVQDETPPVISNCPENLTVSVSPESCGSTVNWTEPSANDFCSGYNVQSNLQPGVFLNKGDTQIVYTFSDGCGNQSVCQFTISVIDQRPPVPDLDVLPDRSGCTVTLEVPTAHDNCDGLIHATTTDLLYYDLPGEYVVIWHYVDTDGNQSNQEQHVFIRDVVAPQIENVYLLSDPAQIGSSHSPEASFSDLCDYDDHQAIWIWGDGTQTAGTVDQAENNVQGTHAYQTPGVYVISLVVLDGAENADTAVFSTYAVVYDPAAGFVTGGGWIESPRGAYNPDSSLTGKANFGFVSKYQTGANIPTGNTSFQFNAANLKFKSTDYEWLVIAGRQAKFKGSGKINNQGAYGFLLTGLDGNLIGNNSQDKFRIKIWDKMDGDRIIYDNKMGSDDQGYDSQILDGGSITIHKQATNNALRSGPGINGVETELDLRAYPNPGTGKLSIQFKLAETSAVRIRIIDLTGKLIWEYRANRLPRGINNLFWSGCGVNGLKVPAGMYYLKVETVDKAVNQPLVRF